MANERVVSVTLLSLFIFHLVVNMADAGRKKKLAARKQYAMYVWTNGFDHSVAGCDVSTFMEWDRHGPCFTHTWNTADKRTWLWDTCNLPGREVSAIFVSDVHHNLKHAYETGNCDSSDVTMVKQMLTEGHSQVNDKICPSGTVGCKRFFVITRCFPFDLFFFFCPRAK